MLKIVVEALEERTHFSVSSGPDPEATPVAESGRHETAQATISSASDAEVVAPVASKANAWTRPATGRTPLAALSVGFQRPGIPLTIADLDTIQANLNKEPWKSGYASLAEDWHSQLSYNMQGPFATVSRNPNVNLNQWRNDMIAVWNLSRMWYFTQNGDYAQKARDILIAWADTQTGFGGMESGLDLGDYAYRFASGADILRGTWPGWTQTDTDKVKSLFNIYWNSTSLVSDELGPTNKGTLNMAAALAVAVFNEDQAKFDKVLKQYRTFASTGLQNSLSNGEHGETGRDQGHSYAHLLQMSFIAEVFWKQGIDVYSERDNRLLAMGEYYAHFNLAENTPFVSMGTTDEYYHSIWDSPGFIGEPMAFNILKSHYVLRKGLSAPWIERKLAAQPGNMDSFMFLKSTDSSTATPPAPITFPSHSLVSTGMTNVDVGGASPAGSGTYNNGIWTVSGSGNDIWTHGSESFHFVYKRVSGDFSMIARVNSVQDTHGNNKAGVMVRSDLNADPGSRAWVAITPNQTVESHFTGWSEMYGGSNWEKQAYWIPQIPYWVKVERVGNIITTYASPDGTSWAVQVLGRFDNMGASPYVGIAVTSVVPGTLSTATFSNVSITTGNGAAPVAAPAAPLAVYASPGDRHVTLRWTESFGAAAYKVKRATTSGGPYETIATVTGPSYVDETVSNDIPYYYVISATNAADEGADSPEDLVIPRVRLVNVAGSGSAFASANNSGSEAPAKAFDLNSGSKWFNGDSGATGWIRYDLGAGNAKAILAYDVISANDVPGRDPRDWQFQGSNNGSTWTTLDSQTNQAFPYRHFPRRYHLGNTTAYRYYRLNITANNGDATGLQLSELSLLAASQLTTCQFNYQSAPNELRFTFDALPHFTVGDLAVTPAGGGSSIGATSYSTSEYTAIFELNTPLPDGNYIASLPGGYSFSIFVYAGDADRDRTVDSTDFNILVANYGGSGKTFTDGDFNYDEKVNTADFNILAGRFGWALSPPAAAPLALGASQAGASLFSETEWDSPELGLLL